MKKCIIISEFNPFHNGHEYLIKQAKNQTKNAPVICLMSGNFTQRGEAAIFNKYMRAKHAILGGADLVLELPSPFACAPAEIFAKGAAKLICAMPGEKTLCFGCECGDLDTLVKAAEMQSSMDFKNSISYFLDQGHGYPKAVEETYLELGGEEGILDKPNNILAVEYIKALEDLSFKGDFFAVKRIGSDHDSMAPEGNIASAAYIRENIKGDLSPYLPSYVLEDLPKAVDLNDYLFMCGKVCATRADSLKYVYSCSEGLDDRIKGNILWGVPMEKAACKRYPLSRIKRALCENVLRLSRGDTDKYLASDLYLKPLAVKKEMKEELFRDLSQSKYPLLVRGRDTYKCKLSKDAERLLNAEQRTDDIYVTLGGDPERYFALEQH